ncbi:hypothetical protein [Bilophila wadsworthia]
MAKGSVWRAILTGTYPDREIRTFDKQESEARAYPGSPFTGRK